MQLNADFSARAAVHSARLAWTPSPMPGVDRRMLDRIGGEVARATSIVRYAPESKFSAHTHTGGEEFFVLEGVFQDEHGDFPAGSYIRNPPESSHTPGSKLGCTIFVKLWQFDPADRTPLHIDTARQAFAAAPGRRGVELMPLHADATESVRLERWSPGAAVALDLPGGGEILVVEGAFDEASERFDRQSWLRLPAGAKLRAMPGLDGCTVWVKTGHLARTPIAPQPGA